MSGFVRAAECDVVLESDSVFGLRRNFKAKGALLQLRDGAMNAVSARTTLGK